MKIRKIMTAGLLATALLSGKEAIAQNTANSNNNLKSRTEAALNVGDEFSTGTVWQYFQSPSANFGIRDAFSFPAEGEETHAVDVGLEARISPNLRIKLIATPDTGIPNYQHKVKIGLNIHQDWLDVGMNMGNSRSERLVVPYAMLNIKGNTFFVSYSELENGIVDISRLNAWGVLDFRKFALGAGTVGLDNKERYVASLRVEDLFGFGIQTQGFFDKEGMYKYTFFSARDKFPISKLASFLMPIYTGANGMNNLINEQNLLGIDIPVVYECMSDPNDTGVWYVWERDNYWFAEADYMLPAPFTNKNAKPILFARYTRNTPPVLPETTALRFGGSLIIPVHNSKVQMTAFYEDNLDDNQEPTTGVQLLVNLGR